MSICESVQCNSLKTLLFFTCFRIQWKEILFLGLFDSVCYGFFPSPLNNTHMQAASMLAEAPFARYWGTGVSNSVKLHVLSPQSLPGVLKCGRRVSLFLLAGLLSVHQAPVSERAKACRKRREETKQGKPKSTNQKTTNTRQNRNNTTSLCGKRQTSVSTLCRALWAGRQWVLMFWHLICTDGQNGAAVMGVGGSIKKVGIDKFIQMFSIAFSKPAGQRVLAPNDVDVLWPYTRCILPTEGLMYKHLCYSLKASSVLFWKNLCVNGCCL